VGLAADEMVDYYEEAEEYLEQYMSDDIPLFTNTVEGVYSGGAPVRTAPAPLETNSDLFVNPMRAQFAKHRANRQAPPPARSHDPIHVPREPAQAPISPEALTLDIPGLQDGIADLQMDDDSDDEVDVGEDFGDIPAAAPSRSKESSPMLQPKAHNSPDASPGLPDKMMSELAFANSTENCDVSPHVIQGLVQIMRDGSHEKRKKSTIAMCNLCCESQQNRTYAGEAGAVPVLVSLMMDSNPDQHLQVCLSKSTAIHLIVRVPLERF